MKTLVTGREITAGSGCESSLSVDSHTRTQPIAIAGGAAKRHDQPMLCGCAVQEDLWMSAEDRHHDILAAIVVQVAEGGAARGPGGRDTSIRPLKSPVLVHRQQRQFLVVEGRIDLLHVVQHVSLGDKQVFPSIVVEIFQANPPTGASAREDAKTGLKTSIAELAIPLVVVNTVNLSGQLGDHYVRPAIIVVVLKNHSHSGQPAAVFR